MIQLVFFYTNQDIEELGSYIYAYGFMIEGNKTLNCTVLSVANMYE